jgi:hypothetical protein
VGLIRQPGTILRETDARVDVLLKYGKLRTADAAIFPTRRITLDEKEALLGRHFVAGLAVSWPRLAARDAL